MSGPSPGHETLIDYITGLEKSNRGAEGNRQQVERLLVKRLGYEPADIEVDAPLRLEMDGRCYTATVDLVVKVHNRRYMAIKCAAGSLASREREIVSAARLLDRHQVPLAVASNGETAVVWDTVTGKCLGSGLQTIPTADQARRQFDPNRVVPLDDGRRHRQKLIFRTYDAMNVHR